MTAEILSRLNAKTPSLDEFTGHGFGALTPADIAGALGLVRHKLGAELIRARVTNAFSPADLVELERQCQALWRATIKSEGMQGAPARFRAIMTLALAEYLQPNPCRACFGRGYVMEDDVKAPCRGCESTGKRIPTHRSRFRACGVPERQWRRTWYARFKLAEYILADADSRATAQLYRALRRG